MNLQNYINPPKNFVNEIYPVISVGRHSREYLDPFDNNLDYPPFSKPSPLECLKQSCAHILQNTHPLPYSEILNEVSHKLNRNNYYFPDFLLNYNGTESKRCMKSSYKETCGESYSSSPPNTQSLLFISRRRKAFRSNNTYKRLIDSRRKTLPFRNSNNRRSQLIQSKDDALKPSQLVLIDPLNIDESVSCVDKSVYKLTPATCSINQLSTQNHYSSSTVEPYLQTDLNNIHENCTCTICSRMQMFNTLLNSWSAVINFIHNFHANTILNSNVSNIPVINLENSVKQNSSNTSGININNNSSLLTTDGQNDSIFNSQNSNSNDPICLTKDILPK
ncbi:unnamed protein product [Heterobilharzia americana]|nr:unnamed protein product [Heterobilharzia americana]